MPIVSMLARICSRVDSMSIFVSPLMTPAAAGYDILTDVEDRHHNVKECW